MSYVEAKLCVFEHLQAAIQERLFRIQDGDAVKTLGSFLKLNDYEAIAKAADAATNALIDIPADDCGE